MSNRTPELATRLADDARAALTAVINRDTGRTGADTQAAIERAKANRQQRQRAPRVIELEPDTVAGTPLEGTITVLGAETGSDLLADFEHAVEADDAALARDVQARLAEAIETDIGADAPALTDVVYHDRTVVTAPVGSNRFGAAQPASSSVLHSVRRALRIPHSTSSRGRLPANSNPTHRFRN